MLKLKRVYEPAEPGDGFRILVDRIWPRGISKQRARIDFWMKEIAPSTQLRKWFGHDPQHWTEFKKRYREELSKNKDLIKEMRSLEKEHGTVTLVYSAHDEEHNQAVALKTFLAQRS
jgi:uncharacterized protein YeaO (DUF488 family)